MYLWTYQASLGGGCRGGGRLAFRILGAALLGAFCAGIRAESAGEASATWEGLDDHVLSGTYTLRFTVETHDGRPAAGKPWELTAGGQMPGDPPRRTAASGVVPPSGVVEVAGLAGVDKAVTAEELKRMRRFAPWFGVNVDGDMVGQVSFFEWGKTGADNLPVEFLPLRDGEKIRESEYRLPPDLGETAPDIALHELGTSRTVRLSDLRGQAVLLEFWSAKCHSCEDLLNRNQTMLERRGKEWAGKAVIFTVNTDKDPAAAAGFVKSKGWSAMRHGWCGDGGTGRYSKAAKAYVVTATPAAILISSTGKILWRGRPHELNVEQTLARLASRADAERLPPG